MDHNYQNHPISQETTCPACGYHVAVPFLSEELPLATLFWPKSAESAQTMTLLPMQFVRCVECGHIYNMKFNYDEVPYSDKPNLMFNRGVIWSGFIADLQRKLLDRLPEHPVVVEIGHGDGTFISSLAEAKAGRYIGFDPHGATEGQGLVEFRSTLFSPHQHLLELNPDLLISRHVLEHLANPLGFLQSLSFASLSLGIQPLAYFEVPCVDRLLETYRTVDLYYEHSSQFTTESFSRMMARCFVTVEELGHGYDGEVIYGLVRLTGKSEHLHHAREAAAYSHGVLTGYHRIMHQLEDLYRSGQRVAIWGGTGKSAAFMNRYRVDLQRFPIVIDSDPMKVGTFVPGMGQEIRDRDWLIDHPVQVVIIPSQWRARDIIAEMESQGISVEQILIEHNAELIDFIRDPHPYRK